MSTDFPARGQQAPQYWDVQLKAWIEEAPITPGAFLDNLIEKIQDTLGASLRGSGASINYDDTTGLTTVTVTGIDAEAARDAIGASLRVVNGLSLNVDDTGDTITIGIPAGALSIDRINGLQLAIDGKADASHTHPASAISDSTSIGRTVLTAATAAAIRTAIGVGLAPIRFSAEVPVTGTTGTDRASASRTITECRMRAGTAPVGSDLVVVVQSYDGTSWSTVTTLTITAGSTTEAVITGLSVAQVTGNLVRLSVTSIGSTTAATDVVVDVVVV